MSRRGRKAFVMTMLAIAGLIGAYFAVTHGSGAGLITSGAALLGIYAEAIGE